MHGAEVETVGCPAIEGPIQEAGEVAGEIKDKAVLDAALIHAGRIEGQLRAASGFLSAIEAKRRAGNHPGGVFSSKGRPAGRHASIMSEAFG